MVMVIGVLAMLFIIGSTLLIVGRFERQTVQTGTSAKNMEAVSQGILEPIVASLRSDVLGSDDKAYNRAWEGAVGGDFGLGADYADYPGFIANGNLRNGDLILSSLEPFNINATAGTGTLFAASSLSDYLMSGLRRSIPVSLTACCPLTDADGDGVVDAVENPIIGFSDSFGGTFSMSLRVIPHNGMVWLDRMTHPALLAQVIHPRDFRGRQGVIKAGQILLSDLDGPRDGSDLQGTTGLRFAIQDLSLGPTDENRLRRRLMLAPLLPTPDAGKDYTSVAPALVQLLPITTGYARSDAPGAWVTNPANQWVMFRQGDEEHWASRMGPSVPMTNANPPYNAGTDTYDRRHLITRESSDDILRPQRDERRRLWTGPNDLPSDADDAPFKLFYDILNPVGTAEPLAYGIMDYGDMITPSYQHVFNTDGLRTQFSLRDVLEPVWVTLPAPGYWKGEASYRRAMRLTAYFLAMIQSTSASEVAPAEQLRTAMQLAVNTIDFADDDGQLDDDGIVGDPSDDIPDQVSTCLRLQFDPDGPAGAQVAAPITVCGVEKQPYITEAYVKQIYAAEDPGTGPRWATGLATNSIYAVELYNPYDVWLDLDGYVLRTNDGTTDIDTALGTGVAASIPPRSYIIIANRNDDVTTGSTGDFVGVLNDTLFVASTLRMAPNTSVRLLRTDARLHKLPAAPLTEVEIDRLEPTNFHGQIAGAPAHLDSDPVVPGSWAEPVAADDRTSLDASSVRQPSGTSDFLVRDSSLQRHKEGPNGSAEPPLYWHFTLSRQMVLPLRIEIPVSGAWELVDLTTSGGVAAELLDDATRPPQHALLQGNGAPSQVFVAVPFRGQPAPVTVTVSDPTELAGLGTQFPRTLFQPMEMPIAPFPVVTADRGIHPGTHGTMAFPTTGTLLLVTRYAHQPEYPAAGQQIPASVAATLRWGGVIHTNAQGVPYVDQDLGQMLQIDNGHLPVFDGDKAMTAGVLEGQTCRDGNNSRFNGLPWGQLVFEYFTALPLEELARDDDPATAGIQARLMDQVPAAYRNEYLASLGRYNDPDHPEYVRFANYPVVMPVSQASSPLGPRVQGRINLGAAPWWVLDGLPVLPDATLFSDNTIPRNTSISLAGLPVPEILAERLDPFDPLDTTGANMAGAWFVHRVIDEKYLDAANTPKPVKSNPQFVDPPAGMPSISPLLAQYMVSYREERAFDASGTIDAHIPGRVGFATVGELCNVVRGVRMPSTVSIWLVGAASQLSAPTLEELRLAVDHPTTPTVRPYSYLGYLQMVTPIVRMQDWMTVKSHVFTIYAVVQSTGQPPVTVRTQVTVDRTRCLYNPADLPERITETPPISYFNAVDD